MSLFDVMGITEQSDRFDQLAEQHRLEREQRAQLEKVGIRGWSEIGDFFNHPERPQVVSRVHPGFRLRIAEVGKRGKPGEMRSVRVLTLEGEGYNRWSEDTVWTPLDRTLAVSKSTSVEMISFTTEKQIQGIDKEDSWDVASHANYLLDMLNDTKQQEVSIHAMGTYISLAVKYLEHIDTWPIEDQVGAS